MMSSLDNDEMRSAPPIKQFDRLSGLLSISIVSTSMLNVVDLKRSKIELLSPCFEDRFSARCLFIVRSIDWPALVVSLVLRYTANELKQNGEVHMVMFT